jgi:subtilisin
MKTARVSTAVIVLALCTVSLAQRGPAQAEPPGRRVLIGFQNSTGPQTPAARAAVVRNVGGRIHAAFGLIPAVCARLPEAAIANLQRRPDVAYIEDDVRMSIVQTSDQTIAWGVDRIDADQVWGSNTGAGVNVAIIDTGIDYDHPDLQANVRGGVYFAGWIFDEIFGKDGSTNPADWNDGHGHGTHCAGIVAALNNDMGVVGVAPNANLYGVKVLGDDGSGYTSDIIQGIQWCVNHNIAVASMSFGATAGTASFQSACQAAYNAGVFLVAAAGNDYGGPVIYPAAYSSVLAVSAVGQNPDGSIYLAGFSNVGPQIELAAPGVSIYSTFKDGGYQTWSGTSMACPHVAGTAALVWATGVASPAAVRAQLCDTAEDLGDPDWDADYGYGLVNAEAAAGGGTPLPRPPVADAGPDQTVTVSADSREKVVTLDGSGSYDPDGSIVSYEWDTGETTPLTGQTVSATFAIGTHTVTLAVTDNDGLTATDTMTVIVRALASPPVADFAGMPTSGDVPLEVMFTDRSTRDPTSWDWDFGDEGTSTEQNPTHIYTKVGTYTVSLSASNTAGQDAQTKEAYITVTEAPPEPPQTVDVTVYVGPWITFRRGTWKAAAWVTVKDGGLPVLYTTIEGEWTGAYNATVTGSTDNSGLELFTTNRLDAPGTVTFTVMRILDSEGKELDLSGNTLEDSYDGP